MTIHPDLLRHIISVIASLLADDDTTTITTSHMTYDTHAESRIIALIATVKTYDIPYVATIVNSRFHLEIG